MTEAQTPDSMPRVLVVAFEGWSDAGNAATAALRHLGQATEARLIREIDGQEFVDFQVHRPRSKFSESGERVIDWPDTRFFGTPVRTPESDGLDDPTSRKAARAWAAAAETEHAEQPEPLTRVVTLDGRPMDEIFLLSGVEPAYRWIDYCAIIVRLVIEWEIDVVIQLGSMYSDTPHSRSTPVEVFADNPATRQRFDARRSDYTGPISIGSALNVALEELGVVTLSVWAQVPHYVQTLPSPKAALALLDKLEELIEVVIPHGDLIQEAQDWEEQVEVLTGTDAEMRGYIEHLESERDAASSPEASGEAIASEFERFLRDSGRNESDGGTPEGDEPRA